VANHIVYIPGLGDHKTYGQHIALKIWRVFGLRTHYFALGWVTDEGIDTKLARASKLIEDLTKNGHRASLVGVSAGASAAINLFAKHPELHKVIIVCGKVNMPENVRPELYGKNPDFKQSMYKVKPSLQKIETQQSLQNILSIYSPNDRVVSPVDSHIDGAHNRTIWAWSHPSVIANTILFHGPTIARFVKQ
jgi:pimeloyl-ACP methyl ester carboxylesterase